MINLIKADLYKLLRQRSFYICIIVLVAISIINVYSNDYSAHVINQVESTNDMINNYKEIYSNLNASSQIKLAFGFNGLIFSAILIPLFISSEYKLGTIKTTISKGFKRTNIFFSKFIIASILSLFLVILYVVVATVIGTMLWGFGTVDNSFYIDILKFILLQLYLNLAFSSVFIMISFLMNGTGGAIAVNLCVMELSQIAVYLIRMLIHRITNHDYEITKGLISANINSLITNELNNELIVRSLIVGTCYIVVTILISIFFLNRKEIK